MFAYVNRQTMKYATVFALLFLLPASSGFAQFLFKHAENESKLYMRSSGAGDAGPGVVVFDLNGDGWDDFYLAGGQDSDKIFLNMGNGTFQDVTPTNIITHLDRRDLIWF